MRELLLQRRGLTNLLRLIAAFAVFFSHAHPISGSGPDPLLGKIPLGELAVSIFFVLSGYFVYLSSERNSLTTFLFLRIARLFPALVFVNAMVSFLLIPVVQIYFEKSTDLPVSGDSLAYFFQNSILILGLKPNIQTVFSSNPFSQVINGSLWTLPIELRCYLLCALISILTKKLNSKLPLFLIFSILVIIYVITTLTDTTLTPLSSSESMRLYLIFFTGALATKFQLIKSNILGLWILIFVVFCFIVFQTNRDIAPFFFWLIIPLVCLVPLRIARLFDYFDSRDYSYGFYLWSFPVSQLIVSSSLANSAYVLMLLGFPLTLIVSYFSWNFIESPVLRLIRGRLSG